MSETDELRLEVGKDTGDEVPSSGWNANFATLDSAVGARANDLGLNGVVEGCTLAAGTALSVTVGTGVLWHKHVRRTTAETELDAGDGLVAGVNLIFYDDVAPFYAAGMAAQDSDVLVGKVVCTGTSVLFASKVRPISLPPTPAQDVFRAHRLAIAQEQQGSEGLPRFKNPILSPTESWEGAIIERMTVVIDVDDPDLWHIWYTANTDGKLGYAQLYARTGYALEGIVLGTHSFTGAVTITPTITTTLPDKTSYLLQYRSSAVSQADCDAQAWITYTSGAVSVSRYFQCRVKLRTLDPRVTPYCTLLAWYGTENWTVSLSTATYNSHATYDSGSARALLTTCAPYEIVKWSDVLLEKDAGVAWRSVGISTGAVLQEDGVFKGWINCLGTHTGLGTLWTLGYVTSSDGINWAFGNGDLPLDFYGDASTPETVDPTVIHDGEGYHLWMQSEKYEPETLVYTVSADGITNWSTPKDVYPNHVYPNERGAGAMPVAVSVVLIDGVYHYFWEENPFARWQVYHGITYAPGDPIQDISLAADKSATPGGWRDEGIGTPWYVYDGKHLWGFCKGFSSVGGNYTAGVVPETPGVVLQGTYGEIRIQAAEALANEMRLITFGYDPTGYGSFHGLPMQLQWGGFGNPVLQVTDGVELYGMAGAEALYATGFVTLSQMETYVSEHGGEGGIGTHAIDGEYHTGQIGAAQHGTSYLPDAHHAQSHGNDDHSTPFFPFSGGTMQGLLSMGTHSLYIGDAYLAPLEDDLYAVPSGNFYVTRLHISSEMNAEFNKIADLADGINPSEAINRGQLDAVFDTADSTGVALATAGTSGTLARDDHQHWVEHVVTFPVWAEPNTIVSDDTEVVLNFANGGEIIAGGCVGICDVAGTSNFTFNVEKATMASFGTAVSTTWVAVFGTAGVINSGERSSDYGTAPGHTANISFAAKDVCRVKVTASDATLRRLVVSMRVRVKNT